MASPLSPTPSNTLNFSTPPTSKRYDKHSYQVEKITTTTTTSSIHNTHHDSSPSQTEDDQDTSSSPFMSTVRDDQENNPPPRLRPQSRVLSGAELSPLKLLADRPRPSRSSLGAAVVVAAAATEEQQQDAAGVPATLNPPMLPPQAPRSPRKMSSPEKRFPVKVSGSGTQSSTSTVTPPTTSGVEDARPKTVVAPAHQRQLSLEEVILEHEGLKHAIDIFEDNVSVLEDDGAAAVSIPSHEEGQKEDRDIVHGQLQQPVDEYGYYDEYDDEEEPAGVDDTMISTLSTFSAVPNLTMLANMRASPGNFSNFTGAGMTTPRAAPRPMTATDMLSPLRTPRASGPLPKRGPGPQYDSGNTTSLMDFTENLRLGAYAQQQQQQQPSSPSRRSNGRTSPSKHDDNNNARVASTPRRNSNLNLLDFDIPPLPTPRSIPTITPRELESLKSSFLSEISSLRASLSGKEAEAASLKAAVGDAEKRVGECMERLREQQTEAEAEREGWERRGREMEAVLRKVKEEIVLGQRDREELEARLEESEKRRDAAETMAQEAESKMAGMRAGRESGGGAGGTPVRSPTGGGGGGGNKEVEIAVERVARELHALYKTKHETKVAALKKSYENRWEKKVRELEGRIEELGRENEELRVGRDATMTRVDPAVAGKMREEMEADRARNAELEAEVGKLEAVVRSVKTDNEELRVLLERERVEKGELVQLAEEMMDMQTMQSFVAKENNANATPGTARRMGNATPSKGHGSARVPPSPSPNDGGVRGSVGPRASGLRAPGAGVSRIGKGVGMGTHGRSGSTVASAAGLPRPGSGLGTRAGGLMSSIERMGSYRGRAE